MTLTEAIPFGSGARRFRHYEGTKNLEANGQAYHVDSEDNTLTG